MMLRARRLRAALEAYVSEYPNDKLPKFTEDEWRHIDYLVEILYPFYQYTNAVGKIRNGPSIHNVYATYNKLFDHIEDYITKLEKKRLTWKKQIYTALVKAGEKLKKYYSETNEHMGDIYAIATILSPRWKLSLFEEDGWSEEDWVSDRRFDYCLPDS